MDDTSSPFGPDDPSLPKILFVANPKLGWKTYSRRLIEVLNQRQDLRGHIEWHAPDPATALVLRHHGGGRPLGIDNILAHQWWLGRRIRQRVRQQRPELVHFAGHWPAGALAWLADTPPFTVALDATRPGTDAEREAPAWRISEIEREALLCRRARHLFAMSKWTSDSLVREFQVSPARISVAPPAVDLKAFMPPRDHTGIPNVIFIGNDFKRKGGPRLHSWVEGPLAGSCHLHIVSGDPDARVRGRFTTVHGAIPQAQLFERLLPEMDLICLPTRLDMSPNVLAEAAAAGLPAVASDVGGIDELVVHSKTGILVDPDDDAGFVEGLRVLLSAPDLRSRMRQAALRHAAETFDAAQVYTAVVDRLATIAGAGRLVEAAR